MASGKTQTRGTIDPAETEFFSDIQTLLLHRKKKVPLPKKISRICAVDAAYSDSRVVAVASLLECGQLSETRIYAGRCTFPYVSGLFYLREGPFVTQAVRKLVTSPQLVCFDAHGAAHPRGAGLATLCGVVLGIPSVGIAKSSLVGATQNCGEDLGRVIFEGRQVGFVQKTNGTARYWSSGFSVSTRDLKEIIEKNGQECLLAMETSHKRSREQIRAIS